MTCKVDVPPAPPVAMETARETELTAYYRAHRRITMEQDLVQQADEYLENLFEDRIEDAEKLALENWVRTRIEDERRGWKEKIQFSFQEVEKERKLALEAHAGVSMIGEKLEHCMNTMNLRPPDGAYLASESDLKVTEVDTIAHNLEFLLRKMAVYHKDRVECLEYLGYDPNVAACVILVVRGSIEELKRQVRELKETAKRKEDALRRELENLRHQIHVLHVRIGHTSSSAAVNSTSAITEDNKSSLDSVDKQHLMPINPKLKLSILHNNVNNEKTTQEGGESSWSQLDSTNVSGIFDNYALLTKSTKVDNTPQTSDFGVQVSSRDILMEGILPWPQTSNISVPTGLPESAVSVAQTTLNQSLNISSTSSTPSTFNPSDLYAIKSPRYAVPLEGIKPHKNVIQHKQSNKTVDNTRKAATNKVQSDAALYRQPETTTQAKPSIVGMVKKAQVATQNSNKQNNQHQEENSKQKQTMAGVVKQAQIATQNLNIQNNQYHDGYLSGVSKELLPGIPPKTTDTANTTPPKKVNDSRPANVPYNKCLRCHKQYSAKDNHKMACRFHPKGKRKLEKYDVRGRLVVVTYIWECCMQRPEAGGCSTAEHV